MKISALTLSLMIISGAEAAYGNAGPGVFGGEGREGGGPGLRMRHGPQGKKMVEACASSLGIALPQPGGTEPSESDREELHACMKAKMKEKKAAMDACLMAAGVEFGEDGWPTSRPSKEQMEACLNSTNTSTANSAI
jgi:hypothetical protein